MMMKCKCGPSKIAGWLVFIGALNWGLVGVGMLFGGHDFNLVHMLLGSWPTVEAIVYVLVGVCAIVDMVGCKCKTCKDCMVDSPAPAAPSQM